MSLGRKVRISILLYVLLLVGVGTWLAGSRTTDWDETLWVTVHPIAADGREATRSYIDRLERDSFAEIDGFFAEEAEHHGVPLRRPVQVRLGAEVDEAPPAPPASGNPLAVAWWSLRLRWYSTFTPSDDGPSPDVRMFVLYHDPQASPRLAHSLGLRKGLVGVVNAFATRHMTGSNAVIIAHELLHTLGARDRYDPATGASPPPFEERVPTFNVRVEGGRVLVGARPNRPGTRVEPARSDT